MCFTIFRLEHCKCLWLALQFAQCFKAVMTAWGFETSFHFSYLSLTCLPFGYFNIFLFLFIQFYYISLALSDRRYSMYLCLAFLLFFTYFYQFVWHNFNLFASLKSNYFFSDFISSYFKLFIKLINVLMKLHYLFKMFFNLYLKTLLNDLTR